MLLKSHFQTQMALGSEVGLNIVTNLEKAKVDKLFVEIWQFIYKFERRFSRFLPMSELSVFNRAAGLRQPVSTEFNELLLATQKLSKQTDGLYNPFILPALQRSGYKQSAMPGYENDPVDDFSNRQVVTIDKLKLGDKWAEIPYGTALDMGGCGKGFLAEKLRDLLSSSHIYGFWLSLGGDVATFGYDEHGKNWKINIQDANNLTAKSEYSVVCPSGNFAIATSGTFRRQNQKDYKGWHHIIDPITLKPATTDVRLVTICAQNATEADVLASCAIILGSTKAPPFLKKHNVKAMFLQGQSAEEKFIKQFGIQIIASKVIEHA